MTMDMAYLRQLHSVSQKPFTQSTCRAVLDENVQEYSHGRQGQACNKHVSCLI